MEESIIMGVTRNQNGFLKHKLNDLFKKILEEILEEVLEKILKEI